MATHDQQHTLEGTDHDVTNLTNDELLEVRAGALQSSGKKVEDLVTKVTAPRSVGAFLTQDAQGDAVEADVSFLTGDGIINKAPIPAPISLNSNDLGLELRTTGAIHLVFNDAGTFKRVNIGNPTVRIEAGAGPFTLDAIDDDTLVITAATGPVVVNLPAASAALIGKSYDVKRYTPNPGAANSTDITPAGADEIDGVNAAVSLNSQYVSRTIQCISATEWAVI